MNRIKRDELAFDLSRRLNDLMKEEQVSLNTLSKITSVNKSTIHNWLNGVLPQPLFALCKIAYFFEISLDELCFGRKIEPKRKEPLVIKLSVIIKDFVT
ncbi:MAG: helix-turn-helix transcriptional regulator [Bdellovibrionales bacterium]|nr:helix-turn-helix transcriptional regulator [Bdellovibrionales bacterium]